MFEACRAGQWQLADDLRSRFMPLEDLRDAWGPARVLHHATELAGIAKTGPIAPYVSTLNDKQLETLGPVTLSLRAANHS